ncbi:hypothetical protein IG631_23317, partial [Alternaria alternata]
KQVSEVGSNLWRVAHDKPDKLLVFAGVPRSCLVIEPPAAGSRPRRGHSTCIKRPLLHQSLGKCANVEA